MNLQAEKVFAPKVKRVGVFGPYEKGGKKILDNVAKTVSKLGYGALTGNGFYPPGNPDDFHKIEEIMPPLVSRAIDALDIPKYIFFRHFPRLTWVAVHHLSPLRGQRNEIEGCNSWDIPMLGFVLCRIEKKVKKKTCNYLINPGAYLECVCPNSKFCFYPVLSIYCPFYDEVNIPFGIKELFLGRKNPLIAIPKISILKPILKKFLDMSYVNHL